MSQLNNLFIAFFLLPYIYCDVDQDFIKKQNNVMKNFFFICIGLTVIGFVIGPIFLVIILPFIVNPAVSVDDDDESIDSSNESYTKERKSKSDSNETSSLIDDDDEEENINEQDVEEITLF